MSVGRPKTARLEICPICSEPFEVQPSVRLRRKTCSVACAAIHKRQYGKQRRGRRNPAYRTGERVGVNERDGQRRWYAASLLRCEAPDCLERAVNRHHVVYEQQVRREGGDRWDPRNAMDLCWGCHSSHHKRGRVLATRSLPDAAVAFAEELFGRERAADYLRRYYDDSDRDPRLWQPPQPRL